MRRLLSVLFWSVLAAAFIGPGTIATATKAGHGFGVSLLWALTFSTVACVVLQEAAARVTVASGEDLGRAIRGRFRGTVWSVPVLVVVVGAVVIGCAAYQTGNILGAVAGAELVGDVPRQGVAVAITGLAFVLLWFGSARFVARVLGVVVAVMGLVFVVTAVALRPDPIPLLRGALVPALPDGSALLAIGLVGTTVVPYNLFLGSAIASRAGTDLRELRIGLAVAVILGGLISMAVLVVGAALSGPFSFDAVAGALERRLGGYARPLFAVGLFAAGLSSAVTAPMAAGLTARGLFAGDAGDAADRSRLYRVTWIAVLAAGVGFACADVKPIPAIVFAQATNGVLLPLVAVFLLVVVNDSRVMGAARNRALGNAMMLAVIAITLLLGGVNVKKAFDGLLGMIGG